MNYKIVVDSCGELTEEMKKSGCFESVPMSIELEGNTIIDDENFDQKEFLAKIAASSECPKSSCPSPERYMQSYLCEAERVYVVTLSEELSGSYNSAVLGKNLYEEEHGEKEIHIFNSKSASVGESLIALKIQECEDAGMAFEEVVRTVEAYIESQNTYFVLETLETLKKNGRLKGVKALVASALNIKPVMGSTPEGTICQIGQARGIKKALAKMTETVVEHLKNGEEKVLGIAHCNCRERAEAVAGMIREHTKVKDVVILDTAGISSMYANDGGIIVVI
nr:DegV family protein [uncultured Faecalimonas sp.]